jgi:hypothetical protein
LGPDLGFHQDADARLEVIQKTRHGTGRVPRLPDLHVARAQQLFTFGASRGGAVRQQQAQPRHLLAQSRQQNRRCPRLAE